jgi:hypothetical protein
LQYQTRKLKNSIEDKVQLNQQKDWDEIQKELDAMEKLKNSIEARCKQLKKTNQEINDNLFINKHNYTISSKQVQRKFKHAENFGIEGNYNPEKGREFAQKLTDHLNNDSFVKKRLTFHGTPVYIHFDLETKQAVMVDATTNEFLSGWKLNPNQVEHFLNNEIE